MNLHERIATRERESTGTMKIVSAGDFPVELPQQIENITIDFDWSRWAAWDQYCCTLLDAIETKKKKTDSSKRNAGTNYPSGHYLHTAEYYLKYNQIN